MNSSVGLKGASVSSTRRHLASAHSHSVERRARIARVAETAGARGLAGKGQRKSSGAVARSAPKGVEDLGNFDDDGIEIEDESDGLSDLDWKGKVRHARTALQFPHTPVRTSAHTHTDARNPSADPRQDNPN